ncbi:MAG TPA: BON domain-containing protein, partial [Bryobacteraceae bacterium]
MAQCADNISSLTRKLQRALVDLPGYTIFDFVTFRITDDHVVLLGDVLQPELKQAAEQGVRTAIGNNMAVENRIGILPASAQDAAIRRKLYDRLYANPQFTSYAIQAVAPVHVTVKNGRVTFEGWVDSSSDRLLVESAASEVVEAAAVEDHLLAT